MDTTPENSQWRLNRKGLVRVPDPQVFLRATLHIVHNIDTSRGIIYINVTLDTLFKEPKQELTLVLPPKSVKHCSWTLQSDDHLLPSHLLPLVPRRPANASSVSTLSLELDTTAKIFLPSILESLSPDTQDIVNALEKISQSKTLYLHFGKHQFTKPDIRSLQTFLCALQEQSLQERTLDHNRHQLVEDPLDNLRQALCPPPYSEKPASEYEQQVGLPACRAEFPEQIDGKRRSALLSILPDDEKHERLPLSSSPPPGSPTVVNTPSTRSPSPIPIPPTAFTRVSDPSRTKINKITGLDCQLRGFSDDTIRDWLTRSGRGYLLAQPDVVDNDLAYASAKPSFARVEKNQRRPLAEDYVNSMIKSCVQSTIDKMADEVLQGRLQSRIDKIVGEMIQGHLQLRINKIADDMIQGRLKSRIDKIFDEMIGHRLKPLIDKMSDENRDLLYDILGQLDQEFHDKLDDFIPELRNAADDCKSELQERFLELIDQLDAKGQQCSDYIQDQGAASKQEKFAKPKLDPTRRRQLDNLRLASRRRKYLKHIKRRLCG